MSADRVHDLLVVGGGYRGTSFLASQEWLLNRDVVVLERSDELGRGGFGDYDCVSTSVASRFVAQVAPEVAAGVRSPDRLTSLRAASTSPVPLTDVAEVMADIGGVIRSRLPRGAVRTGAEVEQLDVRSDHVVARTADGSLTRARHALLATGREERPHPELAPWEHKVVLSSHFISVQGTDELIVRLAAAGGPLVIAGGSHSAVAVLLRLLRLRADGLVADLPVVLVRRSRVRLHHQSLAHAVAKRDPHVEHDIDPMADVCPATGQVNRDSGLRGVGRATYLQVVAGEVPGVRVQHASRLDACTGLLDGAGLVVQALGYHGRAPTLRLPDGTVRAARSAERLVNLSDGTAVVAGAPVERLSVLRVEPTPSVVRDHGLFGQGMYPALARRLETALGAAT